MSSKTNVDELVMLADDELYGRVDAARARIERAQGENRDFTGRESQLSAQDRDELVALRDALEIRSARRDEGERIEREARERTHLIGQAIEQRTAQSRLSPLAVSAANLEQLEEARASNRTWGVIEERAVVTTALAGTAVEYAAGGIPAPRTLWRAAGIPSSTPPAGYKGTVPKVTLPAAAALVAEGVAHAEFSGITPDAVTLARSGSWTDISAEAFLNTPLSVLANAHAQIIARNVDLAVVTKLHQAKTANSPSTAMANVAAAAGVDVTSLWFVGNPADTAKLIGNATFTPTSGPDVESFAARYGGSPVYSTAASTAGDLTVFWPGAFHVFATPLASAVVTDPTNGQQRFGQWMLFGIAQTLVGANETCTTPT